MKACSECGLVNPDEATTCPGCNGQSWTPLAPPIPGARRLDPISDPGASAGPIDDDSVICPNCTEPNPGLLTRCRRCRAPLSGGATMLVGYEPGAVQQAVTMTKRHQFLAWTIWLLSLPCTLLSLFYLVITVLGWDPDSGPASLMLAIVLLVITGSVSWFGGKHWLFGKS